MNHGMKVIIGFTIMIAIGVGILYYTDQTFATNQQNGIRPVNTGSGCAAYGDC